MIININADCVCRDTYIFFDEYGVDQHGKESVIFTCKRKDMNK